MALEIKILQEKDSVDTLWDIHSWALASRKLTPASAFQHPEF